MAANRILSIRGRNRVESRFDRPGAKGEQHVRHGVLQVSDRGRPGIQRRKGIDEHDLPIEPGEVIAKERLHHMGFIRLVAPFHHRGERSRFGGVRYGQRCEGQRRRAFEIARHQEAARRQGRERVELRAARPEVRCEEGSAVSRNLLGGWRVGSQAGQGSAPFCGERRAGRRGTGLQRLSRPLLIGFGQQRQVEKPFARVVHDIERQSRRPVAPSRPAFVFDRETKFGDAARRLRPDAVDRQSLDVVLDRETRHGIIGLRLQRTSCDPSFSCSSEHRQAAAARGQRLHERGDEHRLAGSRQAR